MIYENMELSFATLPKIRKRKARIDVSDEIMERLRVLKMFLPSTTYIQLLDVALSNALDEIEKEIKSKVALKDFYKKKKRTS